MDNWFCSMFNVACHKRLSSPRCRSELIVIVPGQKCIKSVKFLLLLYFLCKHKFSTFSLSKIFFKQRDFILVTQNLCCPCENYSTILVPRPPTPVRAMLNLRRGLRARSTVLKRIAVTKFLWYLSYFVNFFGTLHIL